MYFHSKTDFYKHATGGNICSNDEKRMLFEEQ